MTSREAHPKDFRGRFKELQALELEARKDDLIEELLERLEDLKGQRDEAKSDLETEREARRRLQRTLRNSHPNRQRFAVVILHLDGDCFLLDDQSLRDPPAGGEKTATEMVELTSSYLENVLDDCVNVQIIVKVYGDLFKLWRTYEAAGSNLGSMDLTRFFSHFNRKNALVDFVDFGPRKGSIEKKLSNVIQHYLLDDRVEHILFGSPHQAIPPILAPLDAHLSSPLASPNSSSDHRSRLTLLTTLPSPKDWDDLGYRTSAHFDPLFIPVPVSVTVTTPIQAPAPPRSPLAKKVHHKEHRERAPPQAPQPPAAANVHVNTGLPRLRIRNEHWRDERSPQRIQGGGAFAMSGGRSGFVPPAAPMQIARRDSHHPARFAGVPPEVPSVPSLQWP